jgi:hypothetical protein
MDEPGPQKFKRNELNKSVKRLQMAYELIEQLYRRR